MEKGKMTPKERVLAAISLKMPDRVPVIPITFTFVAKYAGYKLKECLMDAKKYVDAQIKCFREFGYDAVWDVSCYVTVAEAMGAKMNIPEDDAPDIFEPCLKSPADIKKLKPVNVKKDGRFPYGIEVTKKLREAVGPDVFVIPWVDPPFREAHMMRGLSALLIDFNKNPQFVKDLMELLLEPLIGYAQALVEAGADMIRVIDPSASALVISRRHFEEFVFPVTKKLHQAIKKAGAKVMYHACGKWYDRLDLITDFDADIIWEGIDALPSIKEAIGKKVCIMGNVKCSETMLYGTPEKVRQECTELIESCGRDGGFILGPDCNIPRDTPAQNFRAMVETARQHIYPISSSKRT
jgi:uroporphyrinogen decarboxylase